MDSSILIITLAVVTLVLVLGGLVWQLMNVKRAQKEHHHSEITKGKPSLRDG